MATLAAAIQIHDRMSNAIHSITNALNMCISSFESMQAATNKSVDASRFAGVREQVMQATLAMEQFEENIRRADFSQQQLNTRIQEGASATAGLTDGIENMIKAYVGFETVKKTIGTVEEWLGLANLRINSERQLAVVMQNMGAIRNEYDSIRQTALRMQGITPYSSDLFVAGAGELATYLKSGQAVEAMMGTLANYAAGMGGISIDKRAMVEYATQLGKALDGNFQGLKMKGFEAAEWEKKILEVGNEWQRVEVIQGIIARNWDGLAVAMANTPQGQLAQMKNTWDDIGTSIGIYLYPYVLNFFTTLNANMPLARSMMFGFAKAVAVVVTGLSWAVENGGLLVSTFIDNWPLIAPIILGVASALAVYKLAVIGIAIVEGISNAVKLAGALASYALSAALGTQLSATAATTVAQWGLNTAILACPIFWFVIGIIAITTALYLAITHFENFGSIMETVITIGIGLLAGYAVYWGIVNYSMIANAAITALLAVKQAVLAAATAVLTGVVLGAAIALYALQLAILLFTNPLYLIAALIGIVIAVFAVWGVRAYGLRNIVADVFGGIVDLTENMVNKSIGFINLLISAYNGVGRVLGKIFKFDFVAEKQIEFRADFSSFKARGQDSIRKGTVIQDLTNSIKGFLPELPKPGDFDFKVAPGSDLAFDPSNAETAKNTKGIKDAMGILGEDLKYMRDIADREYISNVSYSTVKIDMSGMTTNVNNKGDLDGLVDGLGQYIQERISIAAEGVHS